MKKQSLRIWALGLVLAAIGPQAFGQVQWRNSIEQAKEEARQNSRFVLVHFWSETCPPCVSLERNVFGQAPMANAMHSGFVPVKINLSLLPDVGRAYNITSMPTDVILTPDGRELHRMTSPQDMQQYISILNQVAAHARMMQEVPRPEFSAPGSRPRNCPSSRNKPTTPT